jgi:3-deoxy-D-manno-octulosonic-acid transferase
MSVYRSWALLSYLRLSQIMTPMWRWTLQKRLQRGKETPLSLAQKWVTAPAPRPPGPLVWGHAVGVGEAMALAGLFAQMGKSWPQAHFLITTTARTSGDALHKTGLPPRCIHQFAPVDTPTTVALFLDHWQPALAVWCEMDLWPALIHATAQRGIAHALVNARLDAAALAKRRWGRFIYQALLPGFSILWAQNQQTRDGLIALGASPGKVLITGTIKTMSPPLGCNPDQLRVWEQCLHDRPVWLLASSHSGEEAMAMKVHTLLRQQYPHALLIIAPRAPARGPEIQALCPNGSALRSASCTLPALNDAVYVADTIGEMGLWYRLAPVAMLGGSWVAVGGHNPHEALALGCRVLHGPHVSNFAESYEDLDAQGLSQAVIKVSDLAQSISRIWTLSPVPAPVSIGPSSTLEPWQSLIALAQD